MKKRREYNPAAMCSSEGWSAADGTPVQACFVTPVPIDIFFCRRGFPPVGDDAVADTELFTSGKVSWFHGGILLSRYGLPLYLGAMAIK